MLPSCYTTIWITSSWREKVSPVQLIIRHPAMFLKTSSSAWLIGFTNFLRKHVASTSEELKAEGK